MTAPHRRLVIIHLVVSHVRVMEAGSATVPTVRMLMSAPLTTMIAVMMRRVRIILGATSAPVMQDMLEMESNALVSQEGLHGYNIKLLVLIQM